MDNSEIFGNFKCGQRETTEGHPKTLKRVGKTTSTFTIMTEIKLEIVIENGVIKVKKITIVVKP